jgi:GcrA cell cycle regulator
MAPLSAGMAQDAGAAMTDEARMTLPWTNEEIRELISLWPTNSASQIGRRLQRPRSAVCGKVMRLCATGALASTGPKHFDINPRTLKPRLTRAKTRLMPPPPPPQVDDSLAMRPCSILELDATRCHWPLGEVHEVATLFCGGAPARGRRYCLHHLRMVHGHGNLS